MCVCMICWNAIIREMTGEMILNFDALHAVGWRRKSANTICVQTSRHEDY